MTLLDSLDEIDLSVALQTLYELALQDGDLGRDYWRQISELLKEAASFRQRALLAEEQLRKARMKTSQRRSGDAVRSKAFSSKMQRRIATEYSLDLARMQRVLLAAGKDPHTDQIISAWHEYSCQVDLVWRTLPKTDEELLLLLLSAIE